MGGAPRCPDEAPRKKMCGNTFSVKESSGREILSGAPTNFTDYGDDELVNNYRYDRGISNL
jgi:hypothetical protein